MKKGKYLTHFVIRKGLIAYIWEKLKIINNYLSKQNVI